MQQTVHIRQSAAFLVLFFVLVTGAMLGLVLSSWAGQTVFGKRHVRIFTARIAGGADAWSMNPLRFAPILKPALPAVVNIASSRVVQIPLRASVTDPSFRQFFRSSPR